MAKSLSQLVQKSIPVKIDCGDGDVYRLWFKPHEEAKKEAQDLQDKIDAVVDGDEEAQQKARLESYEGFCRTVTDWDMKDDDGQTIPLSIEGLSSAMEGKGVPPSLLTFFIIRAHESHYALKLAGRRV